jgi:hypothetical protein
MAFSREDYQRQRFLTRQLERELRAIERAERAVLRTLGWPENLNAIADGLVRGRGRKADHKKAYSALMALLYVRETRQHVLAANPLRAAIVALQAGAWAGETALNAIAQAGGRAQGARLAKEAGRHDDEILKLARRWRTSDELQDQYRSPVQYITRKLHLNPRTIQRRLKHLKATSRQ